MISLYKSVCQRVLTTGGLNVAHDIVFNNQNRRRAPLLPKPAHFKGPGSLLDFDIPWMLELGPARSGSFWKAPWPGRVPIVAGATRKTTTRASLHSHALLLTYTLYKTFVRVL